MHSSFVPRLLLGAAVVALSGCEARKAAPAAEPSLLRVAAGDFAFEAPDQVQAGVTTIRLVNKGPSPHHIQLVRLDSARTLPEFVAALKGGGPPPAWATFIGGPNAPNPGDSTTAIFSLEPGSYAMICLIPTPAGAPHFTLGMAHPLTVTAPAQPAAEPASDLTVNLIDYDFQLSTPLTAGHHTIRVENSSQQAHEMVIVRLNPGKTALDFANWGMKMEGPPPGELHGGTTGIIPGAHGFVVTDLTPGDYGLICFFPDMKDGQPHLAHGMVKTLTVN